MGFLAVFFYSMSKGLACCINPQPEGPAIFDQGFLPLALDTPVSNYKTAVLVLVLPGNFISPIPAISGEHFPYPPRGEAPGGRLATDGRKGINRRRLE